LPSILRGRFSPAAYHRDQNETANELGQPRAAAGAVIDFGLRCGAPRKSVFLISRAKRLHPKLASKGIGPVRPSCYPPPARGRLIAGRSALPADESRPPLRNCRTGGNTGRNACSREDRKAGTDPWRGENRYSRSALCRNLGVGGNDRQRRRQEQERRRPQRPQRSPNQLRPNGVASCASASQFMGSNERVNEPTEKQITPRDGRAECSVRLPD